MPIDLTGNPLRPAKPKPVYVKPLRSRASFQAEISKMNIMFEYGTIFPPVDLECRHDVYYEN